MHPVTHGTIQGPRNCPKTLIHWVIKPIWHLRHEWHVNYEPEWVRIDMKNWSLDLVTWPVWRRMVTGRRVLRTINSLSRDFPVGHIFIFFFNGFKQNKMESASHPSMLRMDASSFATWQMVQSTLLPVTIRRQTGQVTKSRLPIFMVFLSLSGA